MAADIQHASFPIGPVGMPTESHLFFNQMIMKYTKYPNAAKAFLQFMMEQEQFGAWLTGAQRRRDAAGRLRQAADLDRRPEEHAVPRRGEEPRPAGYAGKARLRSAGAAADFIVVNMVAEVISGSKSPKEAMEAQAAGAGGYKV